MTDLGPARPASGLAARVPQIEREQPELAEAIRHVIDVASKAGARAEQAR